MESKLDLIKLCYQVYLDRITDDNFCRQDKHHLEDSRMLAACFASDVGAILKDD